MAAHQAPPSLGFSRQEHWSGLPFPSPMHESESEVAQLCPTLSDPMDCSPPGSSVHGTFQARVLEWGASAFSDIYIFSLFQTNVVMWPEQFWGHEGGAFPGDFAPYTGTQDSSHACVNVPSPIPFHASLYTDCVPWVLNCLSCLHTSLRAFSHLSHDSHCAFNLEFPSSFLCVGLKRAHQLDPVTRSSSPSFLTSPLTWRWPLPSLNSLNVFAFPCHVLLDVKLDFKLLKGRSYASFLCPSLPPAQSFLWWVNAMKLKDAYSLEGKLWPT